MWGLIPLLLVPLVVMLAIRHMDESHKTRFTVKEFLLLETIMVVLMGCGFFAAREAGMADHELWSGRIVKKDQGTQSCCHCQRVCDTCSDGKGGTESCNCREVCDHGHDYWWSLIVSTGDEVSVKNCSGSSRDPEIWTRAYVGEPAVVEHYFRNYLKADPDSVLIQQATVVGTAPAYPPVYGLYKVNRAINIGTKMDARVWSLKLDEVLADLGAQKKVNIVVIATNNPDPAYAQVVERDWLYGKLNDAVFILGAPDGETVAWAAVVTLPTGNSSLRVVGRDELIGSSLTDPDATITKITQVVTAEWRWAGIEGFAYLAWAAKPPLWMHVLLYVLGIAGSIAGSLYMIHHDVFGGRGVPGFPRRFGRQRAPFTPRAPRSVR
jgi:hypothetical protein